MVANQIFYQDYWAEKCSEESRINYFWLKSKYIKAKFINENKFGIFSSSVVRESLFQAVKVK